MKTWKLLLPVPLVAALAMVPQSPGTQAPDDPATIATISELQYVNLQGTTASISARNVVEIRLFEDCVDTIRMELVYENGDYSQISAQAVHLLRNGSGTREVKLVRGKLARMRFPRLP